jgi:hypothetical protein
LSAKLPQALFASFSVDDQLLYTIGNYYLTILQLPTFETLKIFDNTNKGKFGQIISTPDNKYLIYVNNSQLYLMDAHNYTVLANSTANSCNPYYLLLDYNKNQIISSSLNSTLCVWKYPSFNL